ncbi:PAS domain S-box protein [Solirubrobacter phytolaccae]|uniref:histidine kinase n=1 Tax=Solirubrobacter phytolaccae TaxID=1404360 RepID=A0A9X3SCZ6_9ACTN|nr:PAS domain S-box protein [Solirubrobacter phytolaccae]MDA0185256.1 PAS domain S-box protein [Solirubrobacter phytolaccae]
MTIVDTDLPERYRALLLAALDCVVTMDHRGSVVEWNPAAERTFGWSAAEAAGREMAELIVPPSLRERHRAGLARYLAGGEPVVLDRRVEITAMRRDGTEFPCELTITRSTQPGAPLFVGYLRDITERHTAEAELHASRARIVTAADDARRRLERDLHDGAQQHLVGLAMTLRLARRKLFDDPAFVAELLDEAIGDLSTATGELRELARGLHPAVLTEGGLQPALTSLAKRAGVPVAILAAPDERLEPTVEITAYFVVAEALTNVARYAEASSAEVRVQRVGGVLHVEVRDDGRGGAELGAGSGLRGLLDRVSAIGGTLFVESPEGVGTLLRAELPCGS